MVNTTLCIESCVDFRFQKKMPFLYGPTLAPNTILLLMLHHPFNYYNFWWKKELHVKSNADTFAAAIFMAHDNFFRHLSTGLQARLI